jgi:nucleotide-binding universal stress UspA family protein
MHEPGDYVMGKSVLVAVDLHSASEPAIMYGIELAARIKSRLCLIAVDSSGPHGKPAVSPGFLERGQNKWIDRAVAESQERAVSLELFVASGRFFEEIIRFVRSRPAVEFLVMAAPNERATGPKFASAFKKLHEEFEGEILLVEKAGRITPISDFYVQNLRENSV